MLKNDGRFCLVSGHLKTQTLYDGWSQIEPNKLRLRGLKTLLGEISETATNSTETAFEMSDTDPTLHTGWLQSLTNITHEGLVEVLSVALPHDPTVHVEPAAIECQVCGNVFHGVRVLKIHMFTKHKEQINFIATDDCTCVCGHTFSTTGNLRHRAFPLPLDSGSNS